MKNNNRTSFIVISGITILCIFTSISILNIFSNSKESNSYYMKTEDKITAKIENLSKEGGKLIITTTDDATDYCIKSTKTTPESNSLCWKKIINNTAQTSIYEYKKYYIWLKDINGNISTPVTYQNNRKND